MISGPTLPFVSAIVCLILAALGVARVRRSFADQAFVASAVLLAIERLCSGMALRADTFGSIERWQQWRLLTLSAFPGIWLVFALSYARGNAAVFLARWRLAVIAMVMLPFGIAGGFLGDLVKALPKSTIEPSIFLSLGWSGLMVHVAVLLIAVLILVNLERTFRATVGTMRWRVKFVLFGVAAIFLVRIYTSSQALLFQGFDPSMDAVDSFATLIATGLLGWGMLRAGKINIEVYPSLEVLRGSLIIAFAAIYLLVVGLFAKVVAHLGGDSSFSLKAFIVLLSLVGLALLVQSDRARLQLRSFLSRNFQRPVYDYRGIWRKFTDGTTACVEQTDLCRSIVRITADVFHALAVSIWLINERRDSFSLAASTSISERKAGETTPSAAETHDIRAYFEIHPDAIDIETRDTPWAVALRRWHPSDFPNGGSRLCVPLLRQGQLVGVLVLGDRVSGVAFPTQDFDLLKCIADQATASLLNIQMSQRLLHAKESEAFQTMATFFVHDLKNAASTLNLMLQNLPVHFGDPAFREDALRGLGKTASHINSLIGRLGQLRGRLELQPSPTDLNEIVRSTLKRFPASEALIVNTQLDTLPLVPLDSEQVQKVVLNLLLNAAEACEGRGEIRVQTSQRSGSILLSVADTGCGMSPEFIQTGLFRPFRTTKKNGLGIGMFQSKMIIKAHGGNVVVTSSPGQGATFEIYLPVRGIQS